MWVHGHKPVSHLPLLFQATRWELDQKCNSQDSNRHPWNADLPHYITVPAPALFCSSLLNIYTTEREMHPCGPLLRLEGQV